MFPVFTKSQKNPPIFLTCKTSITHWGILVLDHSFDGKKEKERERERRLREEIRKEKERGKKLRGPVRK